MAGKLEYRAGALSTAIFLTGCCSTASVPTLRDIAPGWDLTSPHRRSEHLSVPMLDPLVATGYLTEDAFRTDEFCKFKATGDFRSDAEVLACERDSCLKPSENTTERARAVTPWVAAEVDACLKEIKTDSVSSYDNLNGSFDEPILWGRSSELLAYRLYVVEFLNFAFRMVRVVKSSQGMFLVAKRLESSEVPGQGRLAWRKSRRLTKVEWDAIAQLVNKSEYWSLPPRMRNGLVQLDGASYIVEGVGGGKQHFIDTPVVSGYLKDLVSYMERLVSCPESCVEGEAGSGSGS